LAQTQDSSAGPGISISCRVEYRLIKSSRALRISPEDHLAIGHCSAAPCHSWVAHTHTFTSPKVVVERRCSQVRGRQYATNASFSVHKHTPSSSQSHLCYVDLQRCFPWSNSTTFHSWDWYHWILRDPSGNKALPLNINSTGSFRQQHRPQPDELFVGVEPQLLRCSRPSSAKSA
jgi:hypothetical protein